jgi:hypothetical protein
MQACSSSQKGRGGKHDVIITIYRLVPDYVVGRSTRCRFLRKHVVLHLVLSVVSADIS